MSVTTQKITVYLWYDNNQAEEAALFYTSLFKNSRIVKNTPLVVTFSIDGQEFCALNGGPEFKFNPAISLSIACDDQEETDYFWNALGSAGGGQDVQCGWVTDKYGVSWQIVPKIFPELLSDDNKDAADRAMQAMLKMVKLDVETLKRAHAGSD
jgi:predicted 3-demethylubiquinone-9 3-methyltransferase (glyoxalase superfamily)